MDPFEEFESENKQSEFGESDPAADFLAREQAELAKIENNENDFFSGSSQSGFNSGFDRKIDNLFVSNFKIKKNAIKIKFDLKII